MTILKGSEFRTVIFLASLDVFWKGGDGNRLFGPMNNFFKKIPRYSRHCHPRAMRAP